MAGAEGGKKASHKQMRQQVETMFKFFSTYDMDIIYQNFVTFFDQSILSSSTLKSYAYAMRDYISYCLIKEYQDVNVVLYITT